jgi:hypothetical protein
MLASSLAAGTFEVLQGSIPKHATTVVVPFDVAAPEFAVGPGHSRVELSFVAFPANGPAIALSRTMTAVAPSRPTALEGIETGRSGVIESLGPGSYNLRVIGRRGETFSIDVALVGDVNGDFKVDSTDLRAIAGAIGTIKGKPGYIAADDLYHNGRITRPDLNLAMANRGAETGLRVFGASDTRPPLSVAAYMGWGTSAPSYPTDVAFTSSTTWRNIRVINYKPSHYPLFNASGALVGVNEAGQYVPLLDTSFQNSLATDFPLDPVKYGTYVNYLVGNPKITVMNDLEQLQAAGFNGVRLYDDIPSLNIAVIDDAHQLTLAGHPFYVEYEVTAPDLSNPPYLGQGTVEDRINALYRTEVNTGTNGTTEGSFQTLHYVINMVGAQVFGQTVPVVYFTHENLVSNAAADEPLTDENTSVPLLRWGVNALRQMLAKELEGTGSLPAVTTPILAGQVVQVSLTDYPEYSKLIHTIQTDPNAPIAYDDYPYQVANRYFNVNPEYPELNGKAPYVNNPQFVIPNAYPENVNNLPGGQKGTAYYDATWTATAKPWTTGPLPSDFVANPGFTVANTVTNPDLKFSLRWVVDRVNWIYGHLEGKPNDEANQLVAETGWATDQLYTDRNGKVVPGNVNDALLYYNTLKKINFKVGNAPIMYFEAYDEPLKTPNRSTSSGIFSENHYGIFTWSGKPKFSSVPDTVKSPILTPFTIVGVAPYFQPPPNHGEGLAPQTNPDQTATDTAYTYQLNSGPGVALPWFAGGTAFSNGVTGRRITKIPNPDVLLHDGDHLKVTSSDPPGGGIPSTVTLVYDAANNTIKFSDGSDSIFGVGNVAYFPSTVPQGSAWKFFTTFEWLHKGKAPFQGNWVYQDFWARGSRADSVAD